MFKEFKEYFTTKDTHEINPIVSAMTQDEFQMLYKSLLPEEQAALDYSVKLDETGELCRLLIHIKILRRYVDAKNGYTWMDDDGVLHVSPKSSIIELPIDFNTYLECVNSDCPTIGDVTRFVSSTESDSALYIMNLALEQIANDDTIKVEGLPNVV